MICNVCNGIKNIKTTYGGYIMCQNCNGLGYVVSSGDSDRATEELRNDFLEERINKQRDLLDHYKDQFLRLCEETDNITSRIDSVCEDIDSLEIFRSKIEERLDSLENKTSDNKLDRISDEMKELFKDTDKDLDFVTPEEIEMMKKEANESSYKKRGRPKKEESLPSSEEKYIVD